VHLPPFSIPFTAAPATFLSTSLSVSFATSTADFCERTEVEKVALGARRATRKAEVEVLYKNDMMADKMDLY